MQDTVYRRRRDAPPLRLHNLPAPEPPLRLLLRCLSLLLVLSSACTDTALSCSLRSTPSAHSASHAPQKVVHCALGGATDLLGALPGAGPVPVVRLRQSEADSLLPGALGKAYRYVTQCSLLPCLRHFLPALARPDERLYPQSTSPIIGTAQDTVLTITLAVVSDSTSEDVMVLTFTTVTETRGLVANPPGHPGPLYEQPADDSTAAALRRDGWTISKATATRLRADIMVNTAFDLPTTPLGCAPEDSNALTLVVLHGFCHVEHWLMACSSANTKGMRQTEHNMWQQAVRLSCSDTCP